MKCPAPLLIFLMLSGCEATTPPSPQASVPNQTETTTQTEQGETTTDDSEPMYAPVLVIMQNEKGSGVTTTFSPQSFSPGTTVTHAASSTSGDPRGPAKVSWSYTGTDEKGDHYQFKKEFFESNPRQKILTREIIYTGENQLVFVDQYQRINICPVPEKKE
ncbi:hypothetical protein Pan153_32130 [Gimesia panareensis]|uniref:Uncharacterized protein n=1 Tax=Gimesia panareensis TaxID=2527978 RepID=A0A518FQB7_9PLAN|nr:hypothetical protein [Gimesia panareensis]QDV18554.1 hypothetical protein Pan153_32130 [Gimesia panareensis]